MVFCFAGVGLPSTMKGIASMPCFLAHSFRLGSDALHGFRYFAKKKRNAYNFEKFW